MNVKPKKNLVIGFFAFLIATSAFIISSDPDFAKTTVENNFTEPQNFTKGFTLLGPATDRTGSVILPAGWSLCCGSSGNIGTATNTTGGQNIPYLYSYAAGDFSRFSVPHTNSTGDNVWNIYLRTNDTNGAYETIFRFLHSGNDVTNSGAYIYLTSSGNLFQLILVGGSSSTMNWYYTKIADGNWHWVNVTRYGNNSWSVAVDNVNVGNITNSVPATDTSTYSVFQHNDNAVDVSYYSDVVYEKPPELYCVEVSAAGQLTTTKGSC